MLATILPALAFLLPASAARDEPSNPVSRVVRMMEGLSFKLEHEVKAEEGLYEDFMCWGKSVLSEKQASNAAADSEIASLREWLTELDAGKVELTDERETLDKEIEDLQNKMDNAYGLREQGHKDFIKAEEDMLKAIQALNSAVGVLKTATGKSSLVSVRTQVQSSVQNGGGMSMLMEDGAQLDRAVKLGERFLSKVDAAFLRRLLTGQVPKVSYKKINRKAFFKMSYRARSSNIVSTLEELIATFRGSLEDARQKDADDQSEYEDLYDKEKALLDGKVQSRAEMSKENGAKAMSKAEAQEKIDLLTEQIESDDKYLEQTQEAMDNKKEEWQYRKQLRQDELAAISQAIKILSSDQARDLMKKSYTSQGYDFLQSRSTKFHTSTSEAAASWRKAAALIRNAAELTDDSRLLDRVKFNAGPDDTDPIAEVANSIDSMIADLHKEEATDLAAKEQCESDRAGATREAILESRSIDDMSDSITMLTEQITDLDEKAEIAKQTASDTKKQLDEATQIRKSENAEFEADKMDDMKAVDLVEQAKKVLTSFYEDHNLTDLSLLQKVEQPAEFADEADWWKKTRDARMTEAPEPPPKTWEGGYMGAEAGATHIVSTMDIIHEDIMKDAAKAENEEKRAVEAFKKLEEETNHLLEDLNKQVAALTSEAKAKVAEKEDFIENRRVKKGSLLAIVKKIKDVAKAGCDYTAINYAMRVKNRHIELDSLTKAKAILLGGKFSKVDPNREMKPGDAAGASAFLQRRSRRLHV